MPKPAPRGSGGDSLPPLTRQTLTKNGVEKMNIIEALEKLNCKRVKHFQGEMYDRADLIQELTDALEDGLEKSCESGEWALDGDGIEHLDAEGLRDGQRYNIMPAVSPDRTEIIEINASGYVDLIRIYTYSDRAEYEKCTLKAFREIDRSWGWEKFDTCAQLLEAFGFDTEQDLTESKNTTILTAWKLLKNEPVVIVNLDTVYPAKSAPSELKTAEEYAARDCIRYVFTLQEALDEYERGGKRLAKPSAILPKLRATLEHLDVI